MAMLTPKKCATPTCLRAATRADHCVWCFDELPPCDAPDLAPDDRLVMASWECRACGWTLAAHGDEEDLEES